MSGRIILDLSRLLTRAGKSAPTGIDRVELAYAQHLMATMPDRLEFGAMHPLGYWRLLPAEISQRFVNLTAEQWETAPGSETASRVTKRLGLILTLSDAWRWPQRTQNQPGRAIYLNVSHHHLDRPRVIERAMARQRAAFVCLVHDLIPLEFPEYGRAGQAERHRHRMQTVARLADGVIANSEATKRALQPFLRDAGRSPPVVVAHLGTDFAPNRAPPAFARSSPHPFFVCIGTIEPRKNHLLLLNLWRRMANEGSPPHLIVIGRRGWENENIIDMLERCGALQGVVQELNALSDNEVRDVLRGACALLLPSFAEGYGLPVAEALALGVPVICSDLPALREVGRDVADYLDPLDGPAWRAAIESYALPNSSRRAAQLARLQTWATPSWADHMATAMRLLESISLKVKS